MLIVDAQIHIWKNNKPTNPNHRQVADFTADDVLKEMDEGGVNAAVIHPPGWDPNSNALAVEGAQRHPNRLAILGNFPLDKPESRSAIDGMKTRPGMLGLRFALLQPHQQTWGTDITRMPCPWKQCVTMFTEQLPWLTAKDKELIMGRALCNWLGWKLP